MIIYPPQCVTSVITLQCLSHLGLPRPHVPPGCIVWQIGFCSLLQYIPVRMADPKPILRTRSSYAYDQICALLTFSKEDTSTLLCCKHQNKKSNGLCAIECVACMVFPAEVTTDTGPSRKKVRHALPEEWWFSLS
jgi:hypothetical protein